MLGFPHIESNHDSNARLLFSKLDYSTDNPEVSIGNPQARPVATSIIVWNPQA